jgi:hypothetical protein
MSLDFFFVVLDFLIVTLFQGSQLFGFQFSEVSVFHGGFTFTKSATSFANRTARTATLNFFRRCSLEF